MILEDSLPTSRHPLRPRGLLTMNAKQLSSYGGSLETAVTDLEHYRSSGSAVLVLCGGETRAKNLHRLLEEKGIPATLDLKRRRHACGRGRCASPWGPCPLAASGRR